MNFNQQDLLLCYRNLLIVLCQRREEAVAHAAGIRKAIATEPLPGRRMGLHCKLNSHEESARKLAWILSRNKPAMKYFFEGCTDIAAISKQPLTRITHDGDTAPPCPKRLQR